MTLVDRLKAFMEYMRIPISQFADMAQIPRPTLSQILGGRNKKISNELLEKLHTAFPNLNISWLLFGDGAMTIEGIPAPEVAQSAELLTDENLEDMPLPESKTNEETSSPQQFISSANPEYPNPEMTFLPDSTKKIKSIIVFYTDNSFETFNPAR